MDRSDGGADFEQAFGDLYPRARSVGLRILGSAPAAEDAAAEALTRALIDWRRVRALPYRDAWVLRVAANIAVDAARRTRPLPFTEPSAHREDDASTLRLALVAALGRLPVRQREAVVLRHLVGLPEAEVAAAMGLSRNSVKKHLQRGLTKLRALLPQDEGVDLALH